jgi:hypothetical protein
MEIIESDEPCTVNTKEQYFAYCKKLTKNFEEIRESYEGILKPETIKFLQFRQSNIRRLFNFYLLAKDIQPPPNYPMLLYILKYLDGKTTILLENLQVYLKSQRRTSILSVSLTSWNKNRFRIKKKFFIYVIKSSSILV